MELSQNFIQDVLIRKLVIINYYGNMGKSLLVKSYNDMDIINHKNNFYTELTYSYFWSAVL